MGDDFLCHTFHLSHFHTLLHFFGCCVFLTGRLGTGCSLLVAFDDDEDRIYVTSNRANHSTLCALLDSLFSAYRQVTGKRRCAQSCREDVKTVLYTQRTSPQVKRRGSLTCCFDKPPTAKSCRIGTET
jgi:hypothetical protein